jgi:hypothetical protein
LREFREKEHVLTHTIRYLDPRAGDTLVAEYDPAVETEVAKAQAAFDQIMGTTRGLAYAVSGPTGGTAIKEFDRTAPETIITPQYVGG